MIILTAPALTQLQLLASQASELAMQHYQNAPAITIKADNSPVTQADLAVSALLEAQLPLIADFPVLSEENQPAHQAWLNWETFWLIDPIDGTKHFINRTGDFCICIALVHQHEPILGLVVAPVTGELWLSYQGALQKTVHGETVTLAQQNPDKLTVTSSAPVMTGKQHALFDGFQDVDFYRRGSALKFMDLVEGKANIYPKMGDTCEWDSAAAQCILRTAGGEVVCFANGNRLRYGTKSSLLNPHFLAFNRLDKSSLLTLFHNYQRLSQLS